MTIQDVRLHMQITNEMISNGLRKSLQSDAVAYWKLDEATGAMRLDSTGHGNHLSEYGGLVSGSFGKVGNAMFPDRSNAHILHVNSNSYLTVTGTSFSWVLWANLYRKDLQIDAIGKEDEVIFTDDYIVGYDSSIDRFHFWFSKNNATNFPDDYPTVVADSFGGASIGPWYFIAAWFDVSNMTLYIQINNGAIDSFTTTSPPDVTSAPVDIGAIGEGPSPINVWTGGIDEVGFWKRVLTQEERDYLWNGGSGRTLFP